MLTAEFLEALVDWLLDWDFHASFKALTWVDLGFCKVFILFEGVFNVFLGVVGLEKKLSVMLTRMQV